MPIWKGIQFDIPDFSQCPQWTYLMTIPPRSISKFQVTEVFLASFWWKLAFLVPAFVTVHQKYMIDARRVVFMCYFSFGDVLWDEDV